MMLEQIEGNMTHNGQIFGTITPSGTRSILTKGDIDGPMEGIFDRSMSTRAVTAIWRRQAG
jgi:hypothetical protein